MTVGKLTRVGLREVWEREATGFTRWLEENIEVLNEVIDLNIAGAEREKVAGNFSVDLVAEDEDGGTVVIENQLEASDHDHLGKLLTYVAALEAKAAILIVARPRPEHVKAVTWLNETTETPFYLLKVEAVTIGESGDGMISTMFAADLRVTTTSRPVQCLCSVCTVQEFTAAVHLFSHLWGGRLNAILPAPQGTRQESEYLRAIHRLDPDVVFSIDREFARRERRVLDRLGRLARTVTTAAIFQHAEAEAPLRLPFGELPHIVHILAAHHSSGSRLAPVRLVESDSPIGSALFGVVSPRYSQFLSSSLGARVLRAPEDCSDWVHLSAIGRRFLYPPDLGRVDCQVRTIHTLFETELTELEGFISSSSETLLVFLPKQNDLATLCAFWNTRSRVSTSSILVPHDLFLDDPSGCLATLASLSSLSQMLLICHSSLAAARELHATVKAELERLNIATHVAVIREDYAYAATRLEVQLARARPGRYELSDSIRYALPLDEPPALWRKNMLFATTLKVQSEYGERLRLPDSPSTSRALGNSAKDLDVALSEPNKEKWLRPPGLIRAVDGGLAAITRTGQDFEFFLHDESRFVEEALRATGFEVTAHRHNRYARGLVRRSGGLRDALDLVDDGALDILATLAADRSQQAGLLWNRLSTDLRKRLGCQGLEASALLGRVMPLLLKRRLVNRGAELRCPHCDLSQWHAIAEVAEFIICPGCQEEFQLSDNSLRYNFRINELVRRFLLDGGRAVLECAHTLKRTDPSIALAFGGEVQRPSGGESEIDMMALTIGGLILIECKDFSRLSKANREKLQESTEQLVTLSLEAGLTEAIVCVSCAQDEAAVLSCCKELGEQAAGRGVQLDLIMNRRFFISCREETELRKIQYWSAPTVDTRPRRRTGELRKSFELGGRASGFDEDAIGRWEVRARCEPREAESLGVPSVGD